MDGSVDLVVDESLEQWWLLIVVLATTIGCFPAEGSHVLSLGLVGGPWPKCCRTPARPLTSKSFGRALTVVQPFPLGRQTFTLLGLAGWMFQQWTEALLLHILFLHEDFFID